MRTTTLGNEKGEATDANRVQMLYQDRWPGVGPTRPIWWPVTVAEVRACRPRHARWLLQWGKSNGLASAPGVTPGPQGARKRERLKEQVGSGASASGHPPLRPASCSAEMLPTSLIPEKHLATLSAHSNHMGNFQKTPRPKPHSDHVHQSPEEIRSPSVENSKNHNKPVSRQKHIGAEGRGWSQTI